MIETWPCAHCGESFANHVERAVNVGQTMPGCLGEAAGYQPLLPDRVLSLYAPWDYAIHRLGKDIENRSLNFPKFTGWIWLHASLFGKSPGTMWDETLAMLGVAYRAGAKFPSPTEPTVYDMMPRRGRISGIVRITGHVRVSKSGWFFGPLGLELGERHELRQGVLCKGARGLWRVPPETTAELRAAVLGAA